jgi:NitT/TauT family transport system permease protein
MKKIFNASFILAHILFIVLIAMVLHPGQKSVESNTALLVGIGIIELLYIYKLWYSLRKEKSLHASSDIIMMVWGFLLIWEIVTTQLNLMHPVLVPTPENVFNVFATQYQTLLEGVASSLKLLMIGFLLGLSLGVILGLLVGWIPRLRDVFYPIANVLTPIPPVVFAPYLIAIMPTFRSASALVILLGIFWPTFLNMIIRVSSIDRYILESARVLNVDNCTMTLKILFPYVLPSVVSGLKISLTTSVMMLTFAEMMGATKGMGFYIINYTHYANYTNVVAGIILVGVVVTILNWLVNIIQAKAIKWK